MDNLHNRLNLDSGKKNKIYQHSSKVRLETTKIAKFGIDIFYSTYCKEEWQFLFKWIILNLILTKGLRLRELYLRRNVIKDLNEVQFLKDLPYLKVLWLSDNPCSEEQGYRSTILKNLPNIEKLDNIG